MIQINSKPYLIGAKMCLGHQGEALTREVVFDLSDMINALGDGTATCVYENPNHVTYTPVNQRRDGNELIWVLDASDMGVDGDGKAELRFYPDTAEDDLCKTSIFKTYVLPALGVTEPAPEPYEDIIERMESIKESVAEDAESAQESAQTASDSANSAQTSAQTATASAESALESKNSATQSATSAQASASSASASATSASESAQSASESASSAQASVESIENIAPVSYGERQLLSEAQKATARENIDASSVEESEKLKDRVDVLEKMGKGILYDFVEQTTDGNQNVPSACHMADLQKLGGRSLVWNQLVDKNTFYGSATLYGVTFLNNGDGSVTINGTPTVNRDLFTLEAQFTTRKLKLGHVYLYRGHNDSRVTVRFAGGYMDCTKPRISTCTQAWLDDGSKGAYIYVDKDVVVDNVTVIPQLFDLTAMFGAGNEPTIEQFEAMFPEDYYPYNAGELRSVENTQMTIRPSGTVIPLNFSGKSAGSVYDELDLVTKKYIQRVGVVDLGTLDWEFKELTTSFWSNNISDIIDYTSLSSVPNMITPRYNTQRQGGAWYDKSILRFTNRKNLIIVDSSYTDAQSLKSSLNGVLLYYELATPIITDVSDVIDSFAVEGGGSIEFDSPIPVKNTIEYLRYLSEVQA